MRKRGAPTRLGSAARARSPSSSGPQWPARAVQRQRRRPGCAGCWMMRKPSRPPERRGESTCALKAVEWAWLDRGSVVQPPWQHDLHGLSAGGFYRALSACWSACRHRPTRSAAAARCAARPPLARSGRAHAALGAAKRAVLVLHQLCGRAGTGRGMCEERGGGARGKARRRRVDG